MTSGRMSICTRLSGRSLVVPLGDQLQHILHTVHLGGSIMKMMERMMLKKMMRMGVEKRMLNLSLSESNDDHLLLPVLKHA